MTTRLSDIFDLNLFREMYEQGYVRQQSNADGTLFIANYTEKAQFERVWNGVTLNCRGLIYDLEDNILARGFPKFFNWDETGQPYPPTGPMVLSTKFDGSLGIAYLKPSDGSLAVATRGSFASDQAIHATSRIEEIALAYDRELGTEPGSVRMWLMELIADGYTPLFEIIYPANRIVVDYKGKDRLVLLDVIENESGKSNLALFDNLYWPDKAEKNLVPGGFSDAITHTIPQGEEGFVLYWPGSGFLCKMKSAEYIELHRVVTGLSKRSVWEMIRDGKSVEQIKELIPDELYQFVDATANELYTQASEMIDKIYEDYDTVERYIAQNIVGEVGNYRAIFAREAQKFATRPYLFMLLDGKTENALFWQVWKTLKPAGDSRAWNNIEDVA